MHEEHAIKGLLAFLKVVECGSINRAARAMNTSQPSLTRTLQRFEAIIGAPVLIRHSNGISLNPLGERLLAHAKAIRSETSNATRTVEAFRTKGKRQLHIGTVTGHPLGAFSDALVQLIEQEPEIFLRVVHGTAEEMMALLGEGKIEIAFVPIVESPTAPGLIQDTIFYDSLSLVSSPKNPIAKRGKVTLDDLHRAGWVLPPVGASARNRVFDLFSSASLPLPKLTLEAENVPMCRALVMRSTLISAFQLHQIVHEVEAGRLVRLEFDWHNRLGPMGTARLTPHTPLSRKFLNLCKATYTAAGLVERATTGRAGAR